VKAARGFHFEPGTIVVFDRGYVDYEWYQRLTDEGVFLRHAPAPRMRIMGDRTAADPAESKYPEDEVIELGSHWYKEKARYRRIEVWVEARQEIMVLVTNHLAFGSTTIAQIYKERWQIEIFFRYLKQNLRIKTFVGTAPTRCRFKFGQH